MSNQQAQAAPKNVIMISVQASMFGGYKRTTEADITAAGGKLPKTDILTKGGKHIFPTDKLAAFNRIKKQVFRGLWEFGVKSFGSGNVIAICEDDLQKAEDLLDSAKVEFYAALDDLRLNYDKYMDDYINAQPDQATKDIILRSKLSMDDACSRFHFTYDTFMPTPVGKNGSVESMAAKLTSQLYDEVAKAAEEAYDQSFAPMDSNKVRHVRRVGQRAKWPLVACREKLKKLAFLDPNVQGAIEIIDHVLTHTQQNGWVDDEPSNPCAKRLHGLVVLMTDAENFAAGAAKVKASESPADVIDKLCGVIKPADLLDAVVQQPVVESAPVVIATVPLPSAKPTVESAAKEDENVQGEHSQVAIPPVAQPKKPLHTQFF